MTLPVLTEIVARLEQSQNPRAFLATLDSHGSPQVRPVTVMHYAGRFYFATARSSRKAKQIATDGRVEFVTTFSEGGNSGYLRVQGVAAEIRDFHLARKVTTACSYPVSNYWLGVEDPDFFFIGIAPERIEYMKPGENDAVEVTNEFVR